MPDALPVIDEVVANLSGQDFDYAALLPADMGFLEREVPRSAGARLQSARDQLEVAVELARERSAKENR